MITRVITNTLAFFVPWAVVNFSLFGYVTTRRFALAIVSITALLAIVDGKTSVFRFNPIFFLQLILLVFTVYPLLYLDEFSLFLPMILGGVVFNLLLLAQHRYFDINQLKLSYFIASLLILACIGLSPILLTAISYGLGDMRAELKTQFSLNSFGNFNFCLIFASVFTFKLANITNREKLILLFVILIAIISIAVTLSRQNAILVLLLVFVVSLYDSMFKVLRNIFFGALGVVLLIILDFIPVFILQMINRFSHIFDGMDSSQNQRVDQIQKVFEVLADHPMGIGIGYFFTEVTDRSLKVTESSYLDFIVGMGGLSIPFLAMLSMLLIMLYRMSTHKVMVVSFIVCFLFASLFNEVLHEPMFWIMLLSISTLEKFFSREQKLLMAHRARGLI